MRKIAMLTGILLVALLLFSCANSDSQEPVSDTSDIRQPEVEITLWTFPIGNWGNPTSVGSLLSGFHQQHSNIHISVEYLDYTDGDARINQAVVDGALPDLVFEGPERLVATWGVRNLMVDLSDLWDSDSTAEAYDIVRDACHDSNGKYYTFPICRTAHCMAINYDMFKKAGALAYIDENTHTWTTDGFVKAVQTLSDYGIEKAGIVYCKDQGGDQGTRALVNNLYGGSFTDKAHATYTVDRDENIRALQILYDLESVVFDSSLSAAEAIEQFCKKETAMTFCWNVSLEVQHTINNPDLDFEVFPMAFPTNGKQPELPGGIWGLGIFDSNDEGRINAAKCFIRYITGSDEIYKRAVLASTYWPVREIGDIYVNDKLMTEYSVFMPYMGSYYQITPDWPRARNAWWQVLQNVGNGMDVSDAVDGFPAID